MTQAGTVDSAIPPFTRFNNSFRLIDEPSAIKIQEMLGETHLRCIKGEVSGKPVFIITRESDFGHYLIYGDPNVFWSPDNYKVYANGWIEKRRNND